MTAISRRRFLMGGVALPLAARLSAQDQPTFSIGVDVTNVLATVKDRQGHLVHDLTQDDFAVEEDGRPQEIRYFASKTDLPLTIGLLVDISGSQTGVIGEESRASFQFLEQVLRPGQDRAFVFRFYRRAELLTYLSASHDALLRALSHLGDPKMGPDGTALNDTVHIACESIMSKQQGRKALLVLSDGVDTGSSTPLASAIGAAQDAETLIYSLGFYDDSFGSDYGEKVLKRLAQQTGGGYFKVSRRQTAEKVFAAIEDELRNQYSLGYKSDGSGPGFRKIHVSVNRKNLNVQAREGYWAQN